MYHFYQMEYIKVKTDGLYKAYTYFPDIYSFPAILASSLFSVINFSQSFQAT